MRTVNALLAQAKTAIPCPSHAQAVQLVKLDELQARLKDGRLRVAAPAARGFAPRDEGRRSADLKRLLPCDSSAPY